MACGATLMKNGITTADELLGPEGFVGMPLLFGSSKMQPVTVIVKIVGTALRIDASAFLHEFNKGGIFGDIMRRYVFSRMVSLIQTAACNTVHCIQERMASCLLGTADRVGGEFKLTHESIAEILGNRRATVTTQLEAFRRLKLISCGYGRIKVENRREFENLACECYEFRKNAFENAGKLSN
jgi:CRP-like cAMP-binding protein